MERVADVVATISAATAGRKSDGVDEDDEDAGSGTSDETVTVLAMEQDLAFTRGVSDTTLASLATSLTTRTSLGCTSVSVLWQ